MDEPIGERISHYRIDALLGTGGMGTVYRAHDDRLGRDLAIKVLPGELVCDETARARLVREARTASVLNHPSIAQVYDVGEEKSRVFIAMELVQGKTLHDSIPKGGLRPETVLHYGHQIADALAAAHDRGVIHRDLKSTNVMITPEGRVKVLDFGLAKRLGEDTPDEALADAPADLTLTVAGVVLGTPNHLPPEVLRGQPADARSDVWALGIVLYEMVSGRFPFLGSTIPELASSIAADAPAPLSGRVPVGIQAVIARCLQKDPARRYRNGGEVRTALETLEDAIAPHRHRHPASSGIGRWIAIGAAVLAVIAVAVVFLPRPPALRDRTPGGGSAPKIRSLAVLPLVNISGDPAQEYFADGMTEELITSLASIEALKVISRTSVMRYKGTKEPLTQVARALGVDAVVEGSVQRAGDRVRITAQLIEAASDRHLWAQSFERDFDEVLTLQSEVASDIARQVQMTLAPHADVRRSGGRPVNPKVYELVLKGRYEWGQLKAASNERAKRFFQQALAIDPKDARANSGLADAYLLDVQIFSQLTPREGFPKVKEYASKAIAADPTLGEAHTSIAAALLFGEWNISGAEKEVLRALELNPGYPTAHVVYSVVLTLTDRLDQAIEQDRRAIELDPLSLITQWNAIHSLRASGRLDEAVAQLERAAAVDSSAEIVLGMKMHLLEVQGRYEDALAIRERFDASGNFSGSKALREAYVKGGPRGYWRKLIELTDASPNFSSDAAMSKAHMYAQLEDKERTLDELERAFAQRSSDMLFIGIEPGFAFLHDEPRFKTLVRRVGLPPV